MDTQAPHSRGGASAHADRRVPTRPLAAIRSPQLDVDGKKVPYNDQSAWAGLATLNGFPATTVPIGHSPEGLPIGMQVVGG